MTAGLLRCLRHRDNLHKKVRSNPDDDDLKTTYKRYRNYCNILIKKFKTAYEKSKLEECENNPKKTWEVIKEITNTKKPKTAPLELMNKQGLPKTNINNVNEYFVDVGRKLAEKIDKTVDETTLMKFIPERKQNNSFVLLDTDCKEIIGIINGLKNSNAIGQDIITTKFLKMAKEILAPILAYIFNLCFKDGVFPTCLKKAIVLPIHKSGSRDSVDNYRPISILPALSKILEKLINKRLVSYLNKENILSDSQFGFRAGKSTEEAVYSVTQFVTNCLDNKQKCVGVFLDLAKAFDTVSIPILIHKLQNIGIRGTPLQLFTSYLENRQQKVRIGDNISDDLPIEYGVPQGSVLGPTLFLVYLNDLSCYSPDHGKIVSFADDTVMLFSGKTWEVAQHNAQKGLHLVIMWLRKNQLSLNISKTKVMAFSIRKDNLSLNIKIKAHCCNHAQSCSCVLLENVNKIKYLGVYLDNHLNWEAHIDALSARMRQLIFTFKKLRHVASTILMKTVYFSLAQSIITYCILIWGSACKTKLIKIERSQRSLLKVINFKPYRYPTQLLYDEYKVLTVRKLFLLKLIIKQHSKTPLKSKSTNIKKRVNTRICETHKLNTAFSQRHPHYLGPHLYNKINREIKIHELNHFNAQKITKDWLMNLSYEFVESFMCIIKL